MKTRTETELFEEYRVLQCAEKCVICCEPLGNHEIAEMFFPKWESQVKCFVVHGECGTGQGWEIG